ncbi:MAG: MFS transporter [Intrasporangium sp.]|uniref:MFS transporter n=1 Tax=Intrasporangium sp. TaxID=1925024 RepID=UPI002648D3E7|nr:MFS transporter [Intrasporangium sp.]MDN5796288.1 MFS transporter [Intrasporangium sp.]
MATPRAGRREWTALAVLCLPLLIVSMDVSVLFFAVPHISETLQPTATQVLWIFDIYGFVLAGLLLTMGNVADRIGRRRLLLLGAVAFAAASVLAAYASSAETLILARAVLGLGGAALMPSTLGIVRSMFHDDAERAKAVGIWSAVMAGGVGVGPVVSGLLLEHFWWGSVFLINVPFMLLLLVLGPMLLPESSNPSARVDPVSAVLSLVAILPVIHAIQGTAAHGWSVTESLYAAVGLCAAVAFLVRQGRVASPMVDLALFRRKGFGGSVAVQVIGMFGIMGNAIIITQYLQSVLGLSALVAALWSLLPSVFVGGAAPAAAVLSTRIGRPAVMAGGFIVAAGGFVGMRAAQADSSVVPVLLAATGVAVGLVSVATLVTEYALAVAPPQRAGSVSALVETAGEFGGALGMAVLGSILGAVYASRMAQLLPPGLPASVADAASETLGQATVVADRLGGASGHAVLEAGRAAFVDAMHVTDLAAAAVLVLGAVLAVLTLPRHVAGPGPAAPSEVVEASSAAYGERT